MSGNDGCEHFSASPSITLVFFGVGDHELDDTLMVSLKRFIDSVSSDLPVNPRFIQRQVPLPDHIPKVQQDMALFPVLKKIPGNIVIGVTDIGLYSVFKDRNIFSCYSDHGQALLSTHRFRTEIKDRQILLKRLGKQILKTLAMACSLSPCHDTRCVVSYHRYVEDLDTNEYMCEKCRKELIKELSDLFQWEDSQME